jgi:hypothetical protein
VTTLRENFKPVSDVMPIVRRDWILADKTLTNPSNPLSLIDGEWMTLNGVGQMIRAVDITQTLGTSALNVLSWPLWAENGRYDVQAIADCKMPLLWLNAWEFETRIYDPAEVSGANGAPIAAMLQPLKVASISVGGVYGVRTLSGLVGHGGSNDTDRIVGYVTKLPAANNGWLRLRGGNLF